MLVVLSVDFHLFNEKIPGLSTYVDRELVVVLITLRSLGTM